MTKTLATVEREIDALTVLRSPTWLVWSNEHAAWWGPNHCGYTTLIEHAGRYTLEAALVVCGMRSSVNENPDELVQPSPEWLAMRREVLDKSSP